MIKAHHGFTLIELVTVITLVSILSVYAVVKWPADNELKLPAQAAVFVAHLRHVQALAMHWGQPLRLTISANAYSVSCVTASANPPCNSDPVIDPVSGQPFNISLEGGISLSGTPITDFDTMGRPVAAGSLLTASPARTFSFSANGVSQTVSLSPLTGFAS